MKLKDLDPDTQATFDTTIEGAFAECQIMGHAMVMESSDAGFLFVDTERGREKGVVVLSHEELIMLVWDSHQ